MAKRLLVTSSPHYRSPESTRTVMTDVIIALLPSIILATVFFGPRVLTLCGISVASCLAFETLFNLIRKKRNTVGDMSAVVTGVLLACTLPVTVPYWIAVVGAFFAIVVVKMLFGGIGKNFLNPALSARAFLFSWPILMTTFIKPLASYTLPILYDPIFTNGQDLGDLDAIASATPLASLKEGNMPTESITDLFIGNHAGCIGEISAVLLLLGGVYLLARKIITWHIPVTYIGTVALLTFIFPLNGNHFDLEFMLAEILSGGLMLGAIYMATDYTTSPMTAKGKLIYGVGCGVLTVLLRYYSGYAEGVSYAILLMNIFATSLDKIMKPKRYGTGGIRK